MDRKFNSNYRVLWSESRQQWVVADELSKAGGKGKSRGSVSRMLCAALVAGGLLAAAPQDASALTGTGGALAICVGTAATISSNITGSCTATATDSLTLTNAGTIQGAGAIPGTISVDALATGVTIDNSGNILNIDRPAISINAAATGTTITNQVGGVISMSASATTLNTAIEVLGLGPANVSLVNDSTISASISASNTSSARAYGVRASGAAWAGALTNNGTISGSTSNTGSTSGSLDITAYGVALFSGLSGSLSNNGTISGTTINNANETSSTTISIWAYGVRASVLTGGTLTNSGTISATVTNNGNFSSSTASVTAWGVNASVLTGGSLTNSGTISATSVNNGVGSSSISVSAYGVLASTLSGTLDNSGTISATAANNGSGWRETITAKGVRINTLSGSLTNSGAISATASNAGSSTWRVQAYGADIGTLTTTGLLTNSGNISAGGGSGTATATFAGIRINIMQAGAVLNNSGTISATPNAGANSTAYSLNILNVISTGGTVNNLAGGLLKGNISVADPLVAVNNAGTIEIPDNATVNTIAGNYTQQTGGALRVGASSTASFGKLPVAGTADLTASGAFDVNVAGPATLTLAAGNVLPGVLTAGALNAGALTVTDNSPLLDFTAAVNGPGVDLTVTKPAVPGVALDLNSTAFNSTTNNLMTLTAATASSNAPANADIYVALQLPDGTLLIMQPDLSFSTNITPLAANVPVPDFNAPIFNYTFSGVEPAGTYTWFAALMQPGTFNVIGTLAVQPFTFAP